MVDLEKAVQATEGNSLLTLLPNYQKMLSGFQRDLIEPVGSMGGFLGGLRKRDWTCLICVGGFTVAGILALIFVGYNYEWISELIS